MIMYWNYFLVFLIEKIISTYKQGFENTLENLITILDEFAK
jgi:hypothetical protein